MKRRLLALVPPLHAVILATAATLKAVGPDPMPWEWFLIGGECLLALGCLVRPRWALPLTTTLFVSFITYNITVLLRGADCGCLGAWTPSPWQMILLDCVLGGLGIVWLAAQRRHVPQVPMVALATWAILALAAGPLAQIIIPSAPSQAQQRLRNSAEDPTSPAANDPRHPPRYDVLLTRSDCTVCERWHPILLAAQSRAPQRIIIDLATDPATVHGEPHALTAEWRRQWQQWASDMRREPVPQLLSLGDHDNVIQTDWSDREP